MSNIQLSNGKEDAININEIKKGILKFVKKEFYFISELEIDCLINKILADSDMLNEIKNSKLSSNDFYKELIIFRFYKNLKIMKPYILDCLSFLNIELFYNKDIESIFELLKSLLYANKNNIISMISNLYCDLTECKMLGNLYESQLGQAIVNIWFIAFDELKVRLEEIIIKLNLKNIHYNSQIKLNKFDKILWNLRTRIRESVEVSLLDKDLCVIYSVGKELGPHYLSQIVYPDFKNTQTLQNNHLKIEKLNNVDRFVFSDNTCVTGYNLVYPIVENHITFGYLLFHTSDFDFNKVDYNYIFSLIQ